MNKCWNLIIGLLAALGSGIGALSTTGWLMWILISAALLTAVGTVSGYFNAKSSEEKIRELEKRTTWQEVWPSE